MKLLGIETSTEACSAALLVDHEVVECFEVAPRKHNDLILPMCEQVLSQAGVTLKQLDAIAYGRGPGAFTGVRIAASVTQGIALAHDLPVLPISTLENLAYQAEVNLGDLLMPAIDARMDEVYWAIYKKVSDNHVEMVMEEKVQAPDQINVDQINISQGLGTGWNTYRDVLFKVAPVDNVSADALPTAKVAVTLGAQKYLEQEMVDAELALPVYLRNKVVHQGK